MLMKSRIRKDVNKYWQPRLTMGRFWWILLILFSGLGVAQISPAATSNLTVKLIDSTVNTVLANRKLVAYERGTDGKLSWKMAQTTDIRGVAYFDLSGLGKGKTYVLKASPYDTAWVSSTEIRNPGTFDFRVGRLNLTAINGATGSRLTNAKINIYERRPDGSRRWFSEFVTNGNGFARVALPGLGQGRLFILGAASLIDKRQKFSADLNKGGSFRFVVGNKPLNVKMINGVTGQPLTGAEILVKHQLADGSSKSIIRKSTDIQGKTIFDLEDLGAGSQYFLMAKPYNAWVVSKPIKQPGDFTFKVGTFEVTAVNGANGAALANTDIIAYERLADGSRKWRNRQKTNGQGIVRFDLPGLGEGRRYLLAATSRSDNSLKYSGELNRAGKYRFVVGNKPLTVRLVNGISGKALPGAEVIIIENLADGSRKWIGKKITDAQGRLIADLEGLGAGRKVVLRTRPYGSLAESKVIDRPGDFIFKVGTFEVTAVNGANGAALGNTDIIAYERLADGSSKWRNRQKTNGQGVVRFDLPGLGESRRYILAAASPSDNSVKYSEDLTRAGKYRFIVGNKPLNVKLINGLSGQPLVATEIVVKQQLTDGNSRWVTKKATNGQGEAIFDLEGLGGGNEFVLNATPYNGGTVYSQPISQPGQFIFQVGQVAVTLRDADAGRVLSGRKLTLFEKSQSGNLIWRKQGVTNAAGTVHFDPVGIEQAKVFTVRVTDVFGKQKNYYAPWITGPGAVNFSISKNGDYSLDMESPSVVIDSPKENAWVSHAGFNLRGRVNDNQAIGKITVNLVSPTRGVTNATVRDANGSWEFTVKKSMVGPGERVRIELSAFDRMGNLGSVNRKLRIVEDTTAPIVTITSPKSGANVSASSFVVTGTATDNTRVEQLLASVRDPVSGTIINRHPLALFGDQGSWALPIDQAKTGRKLTITLTAKDLAGNLTREQIAVNTTQSALNPHQLINRITFGATPALLDEIDAFGAEAFLRGQLNPQTIDDSDFETMIAKLGIPQKVSDFQSQQLAHGTHSKRQLREVMTAFWENHFNTELRKTGLPVEKAENKDFRQHALGYFRDLLLTSATSPAMLRYLDGVSNRHEEPNENYARELLELHTLGVNGGYANSDVIEAARVFTGWKVKNNAFHFSTWDHDYEEKIVLGHKFLPGGGVEEGMQLLETLAGHPSTARFVCKKLIMLLLTDTPSETSTENCAGGFLASDGHISYVLELILRSPEFSAAENFHSKVKTPLEFVAGMMRNFQAIPAKWDSHRALRSMGTGMFNYSDPTGYDEDGISWLNSHQLLQRILFANKVATNPARDYATHILSPSELFLERGLTGADEIVDYLFELALAGDFSPAGRQEALAILIDDGMSDFNIYGPDADQRLRKLIGAVMSYPQYQLQ